MTSEEYIELYQKFVEGKCNAEEVKRLFEFEDSFKMADTREIPDEEALRGKIKKKINKEISTKKWVLTKTWYYAAAAVMVVLLGSLLIMGDPKTRLEISRIAKNKSISKSGNENPEPHAPLLTLSNGTTITLNEAKSGLLTKDAGTEITKLANGELAYNTTASVESNNSIHKIAIPRGSNYKLTLSDGTKIWLNAGSSLSYPSSFNGAERIVSLAGEAYFEVAKDNKKPFKVRMNNTEVEVLGTHFNISAYEDDTHIKTTLLEGSVRLAHLGTKKILKPNEQATTSNHSAKINLRKVNTQQAIAWKNGYFLFRDNTIEEVMSQVARWYKLDVVYQSKNDGKLFGGIYDKSKKLEELLKGLELTGLVKFKIEEGNSLQERRVIVMD